MDVIIAVLVTVGIFLLLGVILIWDDVKPFFKPHHLFCVIIFPDRTRRTYFLKPDNDSFIIEHKGLPNPSKYTIDRSKRYITGRFRVGTFYFPFNKSDPIDLLALEPGNSPIASEVHARQESNLAQRILHNIDEPVVSLVMVLVILGLLSIVGPGFLYWKWNSQIEEIHAELLPEVQPIPTATGGR